MMNVNVNNADIIELYKKIKNQTAVARRLHISVQRVRDALLDAGEVEGFYFSKQERQEIADAYVKSTKDMYQIADEFNVSASSVRNYMVEFYGLSWKAMPEIADREVKRRRLIYENKKEKSTKIRADVVSAFQDSRSLNSTSEKFGITITTLKKWLRDAGVEYSTKTCTYCGNVLSESRLVFCSKSCSGNYRTAKKYKISCEEHKRLLERSGGSCMLCGKKRKLYVDHNHNTGKVRGLLCLVCNTGLGKLNADDGEYFKKVIAYVGE